MYNDIQFWRSYFDIPMPKMSNTQNTPSQDVEIKNIIRYTGNGKLSGYNGSMDAVSALLMETLMAASTRVQEGSKEFTLRTAILSSYTDDDLVSGTFGNRVGNFYEFRFVLPKGAVVNSSEVYSFYYESVENSSSATPATFVRAKLRNPDIAPLIQRIKKWLHYVSQDYEVYSILLDEEKYVSHDFFPYIVAWKYGDKMYRSCVSFFNLNENDQVMAKFVQKYIMMLSDGTIGGRKITKRGYFDHSLKKLILPDSEEHTSTVNANSTRIYDTHSSKLVEKFEFDKWDYLVLPTIRTDRDVNIYIESMNDTPGYTKLCRYLAACKRFLFKVQKNTPKQNVDVKSRLEFIKYTTGDEFITYDSNDNEILMQRDHKEELDLIMIGVHGKREIKQSNIINNSMAASREQMVDYYFRCTDPGYNKMLFGAVASWYHAVGQEMNNRYSSYGNGTIDMYFAKLMKAKMNVNDFWVQLTYTRNKDGVFSSIIGASSNEIDAMLFSDFELYRAYAGNNSSYADALIGYKKQHNITLDEDSIRVAVAQTYRDFFNNYITFITSGTVNATRFRDQHDYVQRGGITGHKKSVPERERGEFIRILQLPQTLEIRTKNTEHRDSSTKLVQALDTSAHFNFRHHTIAQPHTQSVPLYTFNRADGGLYLLMHNNLGPTLFNESLCSPYGHATIQAARIALFIGGHVDFFVPSTIQRTIVTNHVLGHMLNTRVEQFSTVKNHTMLRLFLPEINPDFYAADLYIKLKEPTEPFVAFPAKYMLLNNNVNLNLKLIAISYVKTKDFIRQLIAKNNNQDISNRNQRNQLEDITFEQQKFNQQKNKIVYATVSGNNNVLKDMSFIFAITCELVRLGNTNVELPRSIFDFINYSSGNIGNLFSITLHLFKALYKFSKLCGMGKYWEVTAEKVSNILQDESTKANNAAKIEQLLLNTINESINTDSLSLFFEKTFGQVYVNYIANTDTIYRAYHLKLMLEAIRRYIEKVKLPETIKYSHLTILNAYLLFTNFIKNGEPHYSKENYLTLSASVYLAKHYNHASKDGWETYNYTLEDIVGFVSDEGNSSHEYNIISKAPLYANIADVPLINVNSGYLHMYTLNDMCSVKTVEFYHFMSCLSAPESETKISSLNRSDYDFCMVTGSTYKTEHENKYESERGTASMLAKNQVSTTISRWLAQGTNTLSQKIATNKPVPKVSREDSTRVPYPINYNLFNDLVIASTVDADENTNKVATETILRLAKHSRYALSSANMNNKARVLLGLVPLDNRGFVTISRHNLLQRLLRTMYDHESSDILNTREQREQNEIEEYLKQPK